MRRALFRHMPLLYTVSTLIFNLEFKLKANHLKEALPGVGTSLEHFWRRLHVDLGFGDDRGLDG